MNFCVFLQMKTFYLFHSQPWAVYTDGAGEAAATMLLRDPHTRVHPVGMIGPSPWLDAPFFNLLDASRIL